LKQKIQEMLQINKLTVTKKDTAKEAYSKLLKETGDPDDSIQMRVLLHSMDGHRLSENIQKDLREKLSYIIECERHNHVVPADVYKWNNYAESTPSLNEIKKTNFRWGRNEKVAANEVEKIKASDFLWKQSNSYGSLQENKEK
jgi:hypothetical protein